MLRLGAEWAGEDEKDLFFTFAIQNNLSKGVGCSTHILKYIFREDFSYEYQDKVQEQS